MSCQAHHQYVIILLLLYPFLYAVYGNPIEYAPAQADKEVNMTIEVLKYENPLRLPLGENVTLICKTKWMTSKMMWGFNDQVLDTNQINEQDGFKLEMESENINKESGNKFEVSILHILNINFNHTGQYTCHATNQNISELDLTNIILNVTKPVSVVQISEPIYTKIHNTVNLTCVFDGYPIDYVSWLKDDNTLPFDTWSTTVINETTISSTLKVQVTKHDNGTYSCAAGNEISNVNASTAILVLDKPHIIIDVIKPIGTNKIFMNWTVNDGNSPKDLQYVVQYKSDNDTEWLYYRSKLNNSKNFLILNVERNNSFYTVRIQAKNSQGESPYATSAPLQMLDEEPIFVPEVTVTGVTSSSITIKWSMPPEKFRDHIHYYNLILRSYNSPQKFEAIQPARDYLYMFSELHSATTYNFQIAACSDYSRECGPWSEIVNGTTMDGISEAPSNASIECRSDNISHTNFVYVSWEPPKQPNGIIQTYNVNLEGSATFINEQGHLEHVTWGPKVTSTSEKTLITRFYNVSANTNYTVRISGVTRLRKNGIPKTLSCQMPPALPDKQKIARIHWKKMEEQLGKWMFKLFVPRISERNGPICCYRIYLVRMEDQQKLSDLPTPEDLTIMSYQEAHRTPKGGAYVAEMFDSASFHNEVFLGDDKVFNTTNSECDQCIGLRPYNTPKEDKIKERNQNKTQGDISNRVRRDEMLSDPLPPNDGNLDISSNYTGFVEIIVRGSSTPVFLVAYSSYLDMMNPGPEVLTAPRTATISLIFQVLCGLMVVILVLLGVLCILHRYTKQAHAQAVEMITFRASLRNLRGRQRLVSLNPPDMSPINKSELTTAYVEHHRDSDYGFQQEFELLPDRFSDRTTRSSDCKENIYKNRYPDIKAYDQTRVKLSQVDGIAGSDYINANFVMGYKERKKFICAQGPMDTTVNDFWRMIWEQHLEMILMLTNLEEYSKTKCAKYWPDKADGEKTFGKITVTHLQETRYSDYIVRDLKIVRISNNGKDIEERRITQYHYLVWKDFMAPEHPSGIIKFVKRVNEAYSIEKGCILVHCSAGVGRTGTLVALDCLLQQLREEGQVSIFNTICDLRHQRNFLVQSLKQYIFIYRALMEVTQYGDTELMVNELKTSVDKLRQTDKDNKCKLEEEFENIINAFEDRKSCSVASGDENRDKNRSDGVLPYDRNRVILTPLSGKEHSTYINASFIEGYDNTESFIISQDPMENTINDFWRMISEQGISVIVMLSELGENKCARYWPEEGCEGTYDHITVRYVQAETCPYYTRREFFVKGRDGEEHKVTHLQYHGWPTVDGEVPEVTRGLIELVDYSQTAIIKTGCSPSMVVHCISGSDRSSMFVGLSILVQQLRTERRVDVFTVTRKLRSQRQALINSYAQYEFLHRAIVNYAELHGLSES
ncbi:tyrosine-protein phosphatase 69D isoform X2 [Anthonomus grandis grandis]|uniref:tyrosine-protein phosphatase 69D isoform X2 n=1 Tax=Anthonomus grandis grandis TaxID=2921223 RepID=UPI0021669A42|nr:tyrosine-protein phosphatase 69D isoform X2 [Anthonomus grandis grandis]